MASSVSRLSVNRRLHQEDRPMSESGMATTGMSTDRKEPRNRRSRSPRSRACRPGVQHLVDGVGNVVGGVIGDARLQPGGQLLLDGLNLDPEAL